MNSLITIDSIAIRQDAAGRYCLNDLHRAAGGEKRHQPSDWLSLNQTQEIVQLLNSGNSRSLAVEAIQGRNGGTYVCKELVYSYAMWISPEFNLKVIRTFDAAQSGTAAIALPDFSDPVAAARAWADEFEEKRKALAYVERQAKYIDHLESLFSEGLSPVQFCKRLNGVNVSKISGYLSSSGWLFDENHNGRSIRWRVCSYARDRYLTEKTSRITPSDSEAFTSHTPVLLHKGAVWLYRRYLKGQLPMKMDWNGEFTHDKDLALNVEGRAA